MSVRGTGTTPIYLSIYLSIVPRPWLVSSSFASQMPRCTADNRASIVPFKWCQDSSPSRRRLMLSYRSCRVPQRVMLQNAAPAKSNQYSRRSELKVRIASAATHGLPCA